MGTYQDAAYNFALQYGVDPSTFIAQINAESGFNPNPPASSAGCIGIAQICDSVSFDKNDPIASLKYAANRMAQALARYGGSYPLALASYNCGVGCADSVAAGTRSLPGETRDYIAKILGGGSSSTTSGGDSSSSSSSSTIAAAPFATAKLTSQQSTILIVFAAFIVIAVLLAMSHGAKPAIAAA